MNWAWATSLDHIWRSPTFPMWLTLAAAGFFGLIVLITLLRAEKSVANGALTVITLLCDRRRGCRDPPRLRAGGAAPRRRRRARFSRRLRRCRSFPASTTSPAMPS